MKYLVVENKEQRDELHYSIADFLWDRGNEVFIRSDNTDDFQNMMKYCDCIISLIYNDCSTELLSENSLKRFRKYFDPEHSQNKKTILVFSNCGVWSNAIPFPHKIFHFEELDKNELTRFFHWSEKLNLFNKNKNNNIP